MQSCYSVESSMDVYELRCVLANDDGNVIYSATNSNGSNVVLVETEKILKLDNKTLRGDAYKDRFYDKDYKKTFTVYGQEHFETEGDNYFDYPTDEQDHKQPSDGQGKGGFGYCNQGGAQEACSTPHICFNESAELKPCSSILTKLKCKRGLRTPMKQVIIPQEEEDEDEDEDEDDDVDDEDGVTKSFDDEEDEETTEDETDDSALSTPIRGVVAAAPPPDTRLVSILHRPSHSNHQIAIAETAHPVISHARNHRSMSFPRTPIPKVFPHGESNTTDIVDDSGSEYDSASDHSTRFMSTSPNDSLRLASGDENGAGNERFGDSVTESNNDSSRDEGDDISHVSAGIFLNEIPHRKPIESEFQVQHVDRLLDEPLSSIMNPAYLEAVRRHSANSRSENGFAHGDLKHRSTSLGNTDREFHLHLESSKMLSRRKVKGSLEQLV